MKNIYKTIIQFVFCVAAFVISLLITLGVTADFTRLLTAGYWIEVASGAALMIIIYNMIYIIDQGNRAKNEKSRYYVAYQTNRLRTNRIHSEQLYGKLAEAVEAENKECYEEKCNNIIQKITSRLTYAEISACKSEDELKALMKRYLLKDKIQKRLLRFYDRMNNGKIRIKKIKAENLLKDKEITLISAKQLDYSDTVMELTRNLKKVVSFVLISVISAVFAFSFNALPFWQAFVKNVTMFFGAAISGFAASRKKTNFKTTIYENRNIFFEHRLGLSDKYIPPQPNN